MVKSNSLIKLYTGDVVAATSSKGNQEKWFDAETNNWIKLDKVGFEALAEAVTSELLSKHSNIETILGYKIVPYHIDKVHAHRKEHLASISPNFLSDTQQICTAYHLLKRALGSAYQQKLVEERTIANRLKLIVDTVERSSGLTDFGAYLTLLFEIDALIANEDRHLNNIAIIENNGVYDYCPIFDNGEAFMLDNAKYPLDIQTKSLTKHLRAKPFNCRYGTLLSTARTLYGSQLELSFSKEELQAIVSRHLHWYQPFFRPMISDRIVDIVMLQRAKHFK